MTDWQAAYAEAVKSASAPLAVADPPVPAPYPNLVPTQATSSYLAVSAASPEAVVVPALGIPGLGTGYDDATSINAAFTGGYQAVRLVPGATYTIETPILPPASGGRLVCDLPGATLISTGSVMVNAGAAFADRFEIAGVTFDATGADIFSGANCARWHVHDCHFIQRSAAIAIWNAPTVELMIECRFERNLEEVYGNPRSIDAWYLSSPSSNTQINANTWRENTCFNRGADSAKYWYHVINTGNINIGNRWTGVVFENPLGGMIWQESGKNFLIDGCMGWDFTGTVASHLIASTKNAGGNPCYGGTITGSGRATGGVTFGSGIADIHFDSTSDSMLVLSPVGATTQYPVVDAGGSAGLVVIGHATTTNQAASTLTIGNGQMALDGSVYVNP